MKKVSIKMSLIISFAVFCLIFVISFAIGKYRVTFIDVIQTLFGEVDNNNAYNVIVNIRFPRIIMASIIGAGLSVSGATYQSLFKNPLVSQDVLGASQGSAFGASVGLLLGLNYHFVTLTAFVFGVISIVIVYFLSRFVKRNNTLGLILGGMLISSLFSAGISYVKLIADPSNKLPSIIYWLMGSLSSVSMNEVFYAFPLIAIATFALYCIRYRLNILSLGDVEAKTIGVNVKKIRAIAIIASTIITASSVAVCGLIGWVGLIIPHIARFTFGSDYKNLIPASMLIGASFLLLIDDLSRVIASSEVPIGILTAIVGAPIFMWLIIKEGKKL